jgi:outer membrane protein OmpA-like peptidoglycan-associated protein
MQRYHWNKAVENLQAEPGIVLTSEESQWRGYRLSGLRDPMAADPAEILRRAGVDPAKVNARWEQYVSQDPRFELPRRIAEEKALIERQTILFRVNSSQLDPEQMLKLADIAAELRKLNGYLSSVHRKLQVEISGYTDPTGPEEKNAALSKQRADAVMDVLKERGINPDAFVPVAMGARSPIAWKAGVPLPELSRRVTLRVVTE